MAPEWIITSVLLPGILHSDGRKPLGNASGTRLISGQQNCSLREKPCYIVGDGPGVTKLYDLFCMIYHYKVILPPLFLFLPHPTHPPPLPSPPLSHIGEVKMSCKLKPFVWCQMWSAIAAMSAWVTESGRTRVIHIVCIGNQTWGSTHLLSKHQNNYYTRDYVWPLNKMIRKR